MSRGIGVALALVSLLAAPGASAAPGAIDPVQLQQAEAIFGPAVGVSADGSGEIVFGERVNSSPKLAAVARSANGGYGALQQLTRTPNAEGPPAAVFDASGGAFAGWGVATNGAKGEWARRLPGGLFGAPGTFTNCGRFLAYETLSNGSVGIACSGESGTAPNNHVVLFGELRPSDESFTASTNLSGAGIDYNYLEPQMSVGSDGTLAVGWYQEDASTNKNKVQVSVRPAGSASFQPTKTLVEANDPDGDFLDDVEVLPDGTVMALVSREPGLEVYSRSPGVGGTWSAAQPLLGDQAFGLLSANAAGAVTLAVSHGPSGMDAARTLAVATRPPDGSFGSFTPIAGGDVSPRNLETGPEGTTFLAWGDYGSSATALRGALAPPGGGFGAPITIGEDVGAFATALAPGGNVLAAWGHEVAAQDQRLMVGGIDSGAPPTFGSVDVPATALLGSPVTLSAGASDWSGLREIRWTLPDGTVLEGATVRHAFAAAGTTSVQVTAVDRAGNAASVSREIRVVAESIPSATPPLDRTKPKLRLGARGKMKLPAFMRGVRVRMHLDEPSRVAVELLARARSAHISAKQNLILASRQFKHVSGARVIRLRPNRRLLGGARHFRVALRVTAVDAAGNESVQQRSIRVG